MLAIFFDATEPLVIDGWSMLLFLGTYLFCFADSPVVVSATIVARQKRILFIRGHLVAIGLSLLSSGPTVRHHVFWLQHHSRSLSVGLSRDYCDGSRSDRLSVWRSSLVSRTVDGYFELNRLVIRSGHCW